MRGFRSIAQDLRWLRKCWGKKKQITQNVKIYDSWNESVIFLDLNKQWRKYKVYKMMIELTLHYSFISSFCLHSLLNGRKEQPRILFLFIFCIFAFIKFVMNASYSIFITLITKQSVDNWWSADNNPLWLSLLSKIDISIWRNLIW